MVEVGAEAAGLDFGAQVAVGGGHHAGVGKTRLGFADALVFAVFQHTQQLGLQFQRQFADLVEEQGAVLGFLEIAGTRAGGAGERALGVAEQGGLDQRRRNRRAVERQIGFGRARRQAVQAGRHTLLAAAGFALDQHREGRRGVLLDLLAQLVHRQAVADDAGILGRGGGLVGSALGILHQQGVEQQGLQAFGLAGLGDEIDGAKRTRVPRVGFVALAGKHQDLDAGRDAQQIGDQGKTFVGLVRLRRQAQIHQGQLRRFVQLHQQAFHLDARLGGRNVKVFAQHIGERIGNQRIVVNDQQARLIGLGHIPSWSNGAEPALAPYVRRDYFARVGFSTIVPETW